MLNEFASELNVIQDWSNYDNLNDAIKCFNQAKINIHNYLDQGLPIPKDELVTLRNYNLLNRKFRELKLEKELGYQCDIRIDNVASRIRSILKSDRQESISQGQALSQSLKTSHNSFATILLPAPAKLEQNQSLSLLPLIAGDTGFVESGQGNRVKELVNKFEKNREGFLKKGEVKKQNNLKLKKLASEAFDTQSLKSPQTTLNRGIGIGSLFAHRAKQNDGEVSL